MLEFQVARYTHLDLFGVSGGDTRNALVSAGYVLFGGAFVAFAHWGTQSPPPFLPWVGVAILGLGGFVAWIFAMRRSRLVGDTPTAKVRSASQGYVELVGRSEVCPGAHPLGVELPPCVWFKIKTYNRERYGDRNRVNVSTRVSDDMFMLVDETGECVVDPDYAEVVTTNKRWWGVGDTRYEAWFLRPGEPLYVLGNLQTQRASDGALDRRGDVAALLRDWKADKADLLKRYDADGDGEVDVQEWQKAVADAEKVVDQRHAEMRLQPGIHVIRAPESSDGRPLLLSNRDPEELMKHYRWWSWFHLAVLVATIGYALALAT